MDCNSNTNIKSRYIVYDGQNYVGKNKPKQTTSTLTKDKKPNILVTGKEQRFFREAQQGSTSFPSGGH